MTETTKTSISRKEKEAEVITFQDCLYWFASRWTWFVVSVLLAIVIAALYIMSKEPVYVRTAKLLLKETSDGKSAISDAGGFSDLGLFYENTNVNNEIIALQSPALMAEVVNRLGLEVSYAMEGRFYDPTLYGFRLPARVSFLDLGSEETASFRMDIDPDSSFRVSGFVCNGEEMGAAGDAKGRIGDTVQTPAGRIVVFPAFGWNGSGAAGLMVSRSSRQEAAARYSAALTVALDMDQSTVINLTFRDVSVQRATDVLNMLISVYNENWIRDKNQLAVHTSVFIDERLRVIEQELGTVDADISEYKSQNLLPDVQATYGLYLSKSSQMEDQLIELQNLLSMARHVLAYLEDDAKADQLLPAIAGNDSEIGALVERYNEQLMQRGNLVASSGERNPVVQNLDRTLAEMRKGIRLGIENWIETLRMQMESLRRYQEKSDTHIAANPIQAQHLLSYERQQKVKESLYLYLLQKREENELSQAFTPYNTRVITPPVGSVMPEAPNKRNILLVAIVLGLGLPACLIFLMQALDTKIRSKKDVENMSVPFLGEIPLVADPKRRHVSLKRSRNISNPLVVKEGRRDAVNEAFRVLRTNFEFVAGKEKRTPVVMVTSMLMDSGKTFLSINLGMSLAIKGKKVLLVDLDLRKAALSAMWHFSKDGLAEYLNDDRVEIEGIVRKGGIHKNLDVIPVGSLPPNPAELLGSPRLGDLLGTMREHYDYILLDCPPVEIVADTTIVAPLVDLTLFVVRAGLLDRRALPDIENLYTDGKYNRMALVVNGVEPTKGYVSSRYGYGSHGYGYGYYGNGKEDGNGTGRR